VSHSVDAAGDAGNAGAPAADRVLRAKYLDWCSARVADRLFKLRPEEIYDLARALDANPVDGQEPTADFRAVVGRLTEELTRELGLPDFAEWRRQYAAAPDQFDEEMVGFWRELSD
jgi:hypothetical protein